MSALRIRKFDPATIKQHRIIFLIGKRNTGKSVLMRDLLYHMPRPDFVLAMAPTEDTLSMYRKHIPESCIFDRFNQEKLESTVSLQKELVSRGKRRNVVIILDDCMYQKGVLKSTAMRSVFMNGRHLCLTLLCSAQYLMDIDVALRCNIDFVFSLRENIIANRQRLYKNFFGVLPTFAIFESVMTACTQDFKALVLDNTKATNADPTDCVLWYKASTDVPEFKLCRPVYWAWSSKYGVSMDEVRRAHQRAFEIETAAAEAVASGHSSTRKMNGVVVVQTEDEHGNVLTNTV